jgi:inorganic pyrophosphatase
MVFDVTIEIPKGTRNKYVFDRSTGRIRLDRTLFTATQYPADYGFVEDTFGPHVDALDALVLVQEPTFPGCLIRCRAVGMFRMSDEHGATPKVLCVPAADVRQQGLRDITDLDRFLRLEIEHFFEIYKAIEPGKTVVLGDDRWATRDVAEAAIRRAYEAASDGEDRARRQA